MAKKGGGMCIMIAVGRPKKPGGMPGKGGMPGMGMGSTAGKGGKKSSRKK